MGIKIGNVKQAKAATVAYTDSSAKAVFTLPANAMVTGVTVFANTAASGGTSGSLTIKSQPISGSSSAAAFATVADVYSSLVPTLAGIAFVRQSEPVYVTAIYADGTGTASAGAWTIVVEYL